MRKIIDLNRSVYELVTEYPELADIMAALGFGEVKKTAILHSLGKAMTIPKGAALKKIPMEKVVMALMERGFTLSGEMPDQARTAAPEPLPAETDSRTAQLKEYLRRLGQGEELASVRADFVRHFRDVEASEIMRAEQELIREGTPITEVQKLCDVHSALFHGATRAEQIANAEKEVMASVQRAKELAAGKDYAHKHELSAALAAIPGHPLHTLTRENEVLSGWITQAREKLAVHAEVGELLEQIRELAVHYAKKGDLLYPLLKVNYQVSGPSDVMWTVDDEIRDELAALTGTSVRDSEWEARVAAVLQRAEEMIYKERSILFPICAVNFTEAEWQGIYRDAKDYASCLGVQGEVWEDGEHTSAPAAPARQGEVVMPGGHMTVDQLAALLNTIPLEITFVDADNINRFFNEGPKVFKRPAMAIDREVFSCHPPKIEPMVRSIIDDFRHNRRDSVPIWMEKGGRTMLVTYMAVRDRAGQYLGTVELVQDMEFAKEHFTM